MRTKKIESILLLLLTTGFCSLILSQPAKITTDKDNYIPGEWVIITGSGWLNDDSVQLILKHPDPLPVPWHSHTPWFVRPGTEGMIYYEWYVLGQESGTSFELQAVGFEHGIPATDYAVTYFRDGAITGVTVNGSPFCAGQSIIVSYTISNAGGQFGNNNIFTAQLSDSLGGFSTPVDIGTVRSRRSGNINAVIPSGTADGTHYRIRLSSSDPALVSNPNASDLIIHGLPTVPVSVTATPDSICSGSSTSLNATSPGASIKWYSTVAGGSPLFTSASGADFSVSPSLTTSYFAGALNTAGCSSSSRTRIIVTVIPIPTITGTMPDSVCGSGQVTLAATSSAGSNINWYSAGAGGEILGTGLNFTTPVITLTSTYYVDATSYGCSSVARSPVTATVNPVPSAPVPGNITQPTCASPTGTVVLNGLPATGSWTITRTPGGVVAAGTGTSATIIGIGPGSYTFSVTNETGCTSPSSADAVIHPQPPAPSAPSVGAFTQPTCVISTGSVVLSGLPATGTWTITQLPGGGTRTGTGISTTIPIMPSGTYTFTVTNSSGCTSVQSENVVINQQPPTPATPHAVSITPPTCTLATGSVSISGLPSSGTWTLTRYPGTISTTGTGTSTTITNLTTGTYNFIVANDAGCKSSPSADVIIPAQPGTPEVPLVGTIIQPTLVVQTGSVTLGRLPSSGTWIMTRLPDLVKATGTGTSFIVTGIRDGKYTFTVTNSSGCTSGASSEVIISTPVSPVLVINDPEPVCAPATVDITSPEITDGSPPGLTLTYWTDDNATLPYNTPATASAGTYYIKGTALSGFYDIKPVLVTVEQKPVSNPGPDQILAYKFSTSLDAILDVNESGIWRADSGSASFSSINDPHAVVSDLFEGRNVLDWIVTTAVCPADTGKVIINVRGLVVPTLITPNGDSWNEYFVLNGLETLGKTDLIIFDRRGREVFRNVDYDNKWNGVDYNGNPLADDTYFFVLKSANGKSLSGYIMIRK